MIFRMVDSNIDKYISNCIRNDKEIVEINELFEGILDTYNRSEISIITRKSWIHYFLDYANSGMKLSYFSKEYTKDCSLFIIVGTPPEETIEIVSTYNKNVIVFGKVSTIDYKDIFYSEIPKLVDYLRSVYKLNGKMILERLMLNVVEGIEKGLSNYETARKYNIRNPNTKKYDTELVRRIRNHYGNVKMI